MNPEHLTLFSAATSTYLGVGVLLGLNSFGLPVPEEVILVVAGAAVCRGSMEFYILVVLAAVVILSADFTVYWLGRVWGRPLMRRRFFRLVVSPRRVRKFSRRYRGHLLRGIFTVRFISGLRAPAYFTAGTLEVPAYSFLVTDAAAVLIHVPLFVMLGFIFSAQIDGLLGILKAADRWVALGIAVAAAGTLAWALCRFLRRRKKATPAD